MNDSIRLGSLRGIPIGVHWSVLLVAWLLAWSLGTRLFPLAAPGLSGTAYWAAGIGVALLFFGSLLAHELAHAVFAQRAGVRVAGITLWLLGGVAKLDGEAPTPGHELRIAGSGPVVSLVLGGMFGLAAWALPAVVGSGVAAVAGSGVAAGATGSGVALVAEAASWLARVNLVLAVFNLLPGAPLDGGRIVRAIAWRFGRDRLRASLLAARLGRIIGFGLIGFGVLELVIGADLGGLWTIVIGLFMTGAAAAERDLELTRSALDGLRVRDVMGPAPVRVPATLTVDLFADAVLMAQRQSAALVTGPDGAVVGVAGITEVTALSGGRRREARVGEIAVPLAAVPVVAADEPLLTAYERAMGLRAARGDGTPVAAGAGMPAVGVAYLAVVQDGSLVGLVTPVELARTVSLRMRSAAEGRPASPAGTGGPGGPGGPGSPASPASPAGNGLGG